VHTGVGISAATPPRAVVLVGFMGAGKSSVGRVLGQKFGWPFEDLDDRIERNAGCTIAQMFRDQGEENFRDAEHFALRELLTELKSGVARVIAMGGGAFVQERNAYLLRQAEIPVLFLDAPLEELWRRCTEQGRQDGKERPLLRDRTAFAELYEKRKPAYAAAAFRVETGGRQIDVIADEIASILKGTMVKKRRGSEG